MSKIEDEAKAVVATIVADVEAFIAAVKQHALEMVHAHGSMDGARVQAGHDAIQEKADALKATVAAVAPAPAAGDAPAELGEAPAADPVAVDLDVLAAALDTEDAPVAKASK